MDCAPHAYQQGNLAKKNSFLITSAGIIDGKPPDPGDEKQLEWYTEPEVGGPLSHWRSGRQIAGSPLPKGNRRRYKDNFKYQVKGHGLTALRGRVVARVLLP